jgi:hypothetical protein
MTRSDKGRSTVRTQPVEDDSVSADERRAQGKALRDVAPRGSQAGWKPPRGRRDPVDLLNESNVGRVPALIPIRHGRMAASAFAFYRGSAALMAADLATTPTSGLRVQACGDAHLMNFGGFATPERNVVFDLNDFDETLPAPFEWDLKRLVTSLVIAAQHLRLSDGDAARVAEACAHAFRERMNDYAAMHVLDVWYDKIDLQRFEDRAGDPKVVQRMRKQLAGQIETERANTAPAHVYPKLVSHNGARPRIKDEPPLIYHPSAEQFPGLESAYTEAFSAYRASLPDHVQTLFDRFRLLDMAMKVVGVGSVGTVCGAGLFLAGGDHPLFLQVKEARASVLEPYAGRSLYPNHGQRVVAGQHLMQTASDIFLGWTRVKSGRDFYLRQLRDVKLSADIDGWDTGLLREYARLCARALARAHARSGDPAMISGYLGSGHTFDDAICEFAIEYSDQNSRDYRLFKRAMGDGRIEVILEGKAG